MRTIPITTHITHSFNFPQYHVICSSFEISMLDAFKQMLRILPVLYTWRTIKPRNGEPRGEGNKNKAFFLCVCKNKALLVWKGGGIYN